MNFKDALDPVEAFIKDLDDSIDELRDKPVETEYEAKVKKIDLQHNRLRALACRARTLFLINKLDLMLAKFQLSDEVENLKHNINCCCHSSTIKRKSNVINDELCPKKIKLQETKLEKQKATRSSKQTNKENQKKVTPPNKHPSRTQEKVSEPQVSINTINSVPSTTKTAPKTPKPPSLPLHNTTNSIWPVHTKKTIFLNNPPIKDSKVNKNVGYYSHAYAKESLGYDPDKLPEVRTQGIGINCNGIAANSSNISLNNQQACQTRLKPAFNLSVAPGYKFNLLPGYVVQSQTQVHRSECSDVLNKKIESSGSTSKVSLSINPTNIPDEIGEGSNCNNNCTNKLFRELLCNKNNDIKEEEVNSIDSMETVVITTNITTELQEMSQEY